MTSSTRASDPLLAVLSRVPALEGVLRRFPRATQAVRDVAMLASALAGEQRPVSTLYGTPSRAQVTIPGERKLRVVEVRRETPNAISIVLERPADLEMKAGQFLTLILTINGVELRRSYSISSSPNDRKHLVITVKKVDGGVASTWIHEHVIAGMTLRARGPSGAFVFEPGLANELVLIAGGSGITPVMSILRVALEDTTDTRVSLVFANTSEDSMIFAREITALSEKYAGRLRVTHVLETAGKTPCVNGRADREVVRTALAEVGENPKAYVCGPPAMMDAVVDDLIALGVSRTQILVERFASVRASSTPASAQPRRLDVMGASAVVPPGKTVLEAASDAGISLDFSCTMGGCGACKARLVAGEVTHDEPNCLTQQERDAGMILACVARPLSDIAIERLS